MKNTLKPSERGPTNDEIIAEAKRISDLEWEGNEEHADFFGPLLFRLQADTSWFKPVPEVDEATKVTRSVLHAHQRAMTPPDSGWGNMSYEKGSYDDLPAFQAARAVIAALEKSPSPDDEYRLMLLELLAVIHRDGGHTVQEIGVKLAWQQAMEIVPAERAKRPRVEVPSEVLEAARKVKADLPLPLAGYAHILADFILSLSQEPRS